MTYEVYIINGFYEDGITSTSSIFSGTREACWTEFYRLMQLEDKYFDNYLVKKPAGDWSNCAAGYPTRWDDPIKEIA